jgi:hypothetical protein
MLFRSNDSLLVELNVITAVFVVRKLLAVTETFVVFTEPFYFEDEKTLLEVRQDLLMTFASYLACESYCLCISSC